jgi:serine/threonine protein kinase
MELASASGVSGFGYIMLLREPRFKGLIDLMKRRVEPSFRALATAGFELAHSYLQLHSKGLCYCDISFGNAFFDPETGEVRICDNDNVTVNGQEGGVSGTPRFMAPEIVRGEALPSTQTDLFSLSVLLFYMLMVHHPLEGKKESSIRCLDLPAMTKLYGTEPLFIFDPNDRSNEPVRGYHDNVIDFWPIYPQFLRDLFTRAFTDGIRDPQNGRVRESEWRVAMVRLRDSIIYCPSCASDNFYNADTLKSSGGKPTPCWLCKKEIQLPPRIRIGRNIVMLNHDTKLYPHHIDEAKLYDFSTSVAEVNRHPTDPKIWGLKNLSGEKWVCTIDEGAVKDVEPGRSVTLAVGTKINFGKTEGEIRL